MGFLTEQKPYSYHEIGKVFSSRFVEKDETVSFELGSYTGKLIIDPTLVWGTYYGDAGFDVSLSVQVDVFGDVYLGGVTEATNNIATTGSHQTTHGGDIRDAYLAKFNSSGQRIWATYYGGSDLDAAYAVSCDPWGYVYLGGHSGSASNISTTGSHQPSLFLNTTANAFLAKFDSSGMRIWGTYYGGLGYAFGAMGLACDNAGSVFMTGATPCNSNIATPGSHQDTHSGGFWQINDAYLVKFDSAGVRQWGTYFGDTSDDWAYAVCTDEDGNAYIAGDTKSEQHMSTSGSHQQVFGGGNSDGFLAKFSGQGNLIWSTYYGGTEEDDAYGVSCKGSTLYLGGLSMSTTGIATTGAYQTVMAGWQDAFLARFDTSGVRQWGTYYGGPEWESNGYGSNNISCDNNLNCYLSTLSRSESGIVLPGAHQPKYGGDFQDLAIAKFDPSGNPLWSTYYGGCEIDAAASLATDNNGHVYVAGATQSGNEIATAGSFKETITAGAGGDGLLAKLSDVPTVPDTIAGPASACEGDVVMYVVSPVFGAISYTWILPNGWTGSSTTDTILATVAAPGGEIVVIAHRDCHNDTLVTEMITVHPLPEPLVSVSFATLSTGSYTSYQWYYNGNALSGATGQSHLAIADGDYYVVVTDTNGCSNNSDTVNISNVMVYEPGRQNAGVSLYPNPVYQDFNLEVSESCAAELSDIQGRTLQRYTVQKGKNMLELPAGLASGVYLLHCKGAHTNITFRVTKE